VAATRLLRKGEEEEDEDEENNSSSVEAKKQPQKHTKQQQQSTVHTKQRKNKKKSPTPPQKPKPGSKMVPFVTISGGAFFCFSCAEISPLGDQKKETRRVSGITTCVNELQWLLPRP
jgi:hypothetical protein